MYLFTINGSETIYEHIEPDVLNTIASFHTDTYAYPFDSRHYHNNRKKRDRTPL